MFHLALKKTTSNLKHDTQALPEILEMYLVANEICNISRMPTYCCMLYRMKYIANNTILYNCMNITDTMTNKEKKETNNLR